MSAVADSVHSSVTCGQVELSDLRAFGGPRPLFHNPFHYCKFPRQILRFFFVTLCFSTLVQSADGRGFVEADTHKFEVRRARLSSWPAAAFADASSAGVKAFCIQHGGLDGLQPEDWLTRIWFFRVGGDELLEPKLVSLCRRGDWSSSVLHASPGRRVVVGAWPMGGLSCPPCVAALRRPAPDHVRAAGAVFTWAVLWFLVAPSEEASWCCDLFRPLLAL